MITLKWFFGDKEELKDARYIRNEVFVKEQNVPVSIEDDGNDGACVHLVAYDNEQPVATGRVHITDDDMDYIIGRVATLAEYRGRGISTGIVDALIEACVQMGGNRQIAHVQTAATGFYERLGFKICGEEYDVSGIPHVMMEHFGTNKQCNGKCSICGMRGC